MARPGTVGPGPVLGDSALPFSGLIGTCQCCDPVMSACIRPLRM